jgi:hypothetical protein
MKKYLLFIPFGLFLACQAEDPPQPQAAPPSSTSRMQLLTAHYWTLDHITTSTGSPLNEPSPFTEKYDIDSTTHFQLNMTNSTGKWYFYSNEDSIQLLHASNTSDNKRGIMKLTATELWYQDGHGHKYYLIAQ